MDVLSFIIGIGVGAGAMKLYMGKAKDTCEEQLHTEHVENLTREEELTHSEKIEITADGIVETDPTDEELIIATVKSLKHSNSPVSLAAVARESGLSNYKVSKHKELIKKLNA